MRIVVALAWFAVMALYLLTAPLLPEVVGDPGKQISRVAYVALMMGACSFALLVSGGAVMAAIARRWPLLVNLPYRTYWLAPERREASIARMLGLMDGLRLLMLVLFAGIQLFMLGRMHPDWPQPPDWIGPAALGAFALGMLALTLRVYRAFPAPPAR